MFIPPLNLDTLALFDEFHIGGRQATKAFVKNLRINASSRVLDLGCGLGGPARYIAGATGARVAGVDLSAEFIETGRELTGMPPRPGCQWARGIFRCRWCGNQGGAVASRTGGGFADLSRSLRLHPAAPHPTLVGTRGDNR